MSVLGRIGKTPGVATSMNREGEQGWRCVSLMPDGNAANLWALLEREMK